MIILWTISQIPHLFTSFALKLRPSFTSFARFTHRPLQGVSRFLQALGSLGDFVGLQLRCPGTNCRSAREGVLRKDPQVTVGFLIRSCLTWMIFGNPHDLGNLPLDLNSCGCDLGSFWRSMLVLLNSRSFCICSHSNHHCIVIYYMDPVPSETVLDLRRLRLDPQIRQDGLVPESVPSHRHHHSSFPKKIDLITITTKNLRIKIQYLSI